MDILIEKNSKPDLHIKGDVDRFEEMDVGDSFLVDVERRQSLMTTASIYFHRATKRVFKSTVKGQPKGKVRFWRDK